MNSTDVTPTRIAAAKDAATSFVRDLPAGINLGVESFSGTPTVLVSPTTDRDQAVRAIGSLTLAEATATGEALAAALTTIDTLIPDQGQGPPPARIVLRSDGKQTVGRDEFDVAKQAGAAHIPISTISFGTPYGTVGIQGEQVSVPVDDASLAQVANSPAATSTRLKATSRSTRSMTPSSSKSATRPCTATSARSGWPWAPWPV
jgi:Ca-activated chloride channel family protein